MSWSYMDFKQLRCERKIQKIISLTIYIQISIFIELKQKELLMQTLTKGGN